MTFCLMKMCIRDRLIIKATQDKQQQVGEVLRDSMKMLAEVTNCTTVMMLDSDRGSTLKLLQLMLVEPGKALLVIIKMCIRDSRYRENCRSR